MDFFLHWDTLGWYWLQQSHNAKITREMGLQASRSEDLVLILGDAGWMKELGGDLVQRAATNSKSVEGSRKAKETHTGN